MRTAHTSFANLPKPARDFAEAAKRSVSLGAHEQALKSISFIADHLQMSIPVLYLTWTIHAKMGNFELACTFADYLVEFHPGFSRGYVCKAVTLQQLGRVEESLPYIQKVRTLLPKSEAILRLLAKTYLKLNRWDDRKTLQSWRRLVTSDVLDQVMLTDKELGYLIFAADEIV